MGLASETRAWKCIEAAQRRIRGRVFRMGMAGRYHIGKGSEIIEDPGLIEKYVEPLDDEGEPEGYLGSLPILIERTAEKDGKCAELWASISSREDRDVYDREAADLAGLLLMYRFNIRSYELLVRQPRKPLLEQATRLLGGGVEHRDDVDELESRLRLTLREFVDSEGEIGNDLRRLDDVLAEIVSTHEGWAREKAKSIDEADPEAPRFALCGLSKAAEVYSHRRGYRFRTYAQHWIEAAVREKKTWKT